MASAASRCFRSSSAVVIAIFLAVACFAQEPSVPPRSSVPPASAPESGAPSQNSNPGAPNTGSSTPDSSQLPADSGITEVPKAGQASGDDQSMFVFKKQVQEVVLHATVLDEQRRLVPSLDKSAFTVYQDGVPQTITSFRREDVPVAIGVVIDNSGSMRDKREKVNQAVMNLIQASNPQDEIFVVNFSQNPYLDQDFTSDANLLRAALHQVSTKGSTALYDAIVASAVHLKNNPRLDKKVLLVITDGQDNMSQETLQEAARRLQQRSGPTLYAVGLLGPGLQQRGREALQSLADSTGGVAYFPDTLDQVDSITREVAHDIRSQYILAYKPRNQNVKPGFQSVRVEAHAPGHGRLTVRTQTGYFEGNNNR